MNDYRRPITADELIRQYDLNSLKKTKTTVYNQIKELNSGLQSTNTNLENFVEATTSNIENLQDQIDGNITTWFYNGVPTLQNAPAVDWSTDTEKDNHLGDLYYDQNTGYSYRFAKTNNTYSWIKLTDSDITEALALANAAQDTADSKRRVFVTQPTTPYDVGDMWTNGTDLYRCRVTRASGSFSESDWILATNYTDDSYARGVEAALNSYKTEVSTTYSTKSELTTATDEISGSVSALTTRTTTLEGEMVNKASTEQVSALSIRADGIESSVTSVSNRVTQNELAIDTKAQVFKTTPTVPYYENDVYITNGQVYVCTNERTEGSYTASDWTIQVNTENLVTSTQFSQTIDQVNINVTTATNTANSASSAASAAQSTADSASSAASAAQTTANTANNKIDNLKVGGRNITLGTTEWFTTFNGAYQCTCTAERVEDSSVPSGYAIKYAISPTVQGGNAAGVYYTKEYMVANDLTKMTEGETYTISYYIKADTNTTMRTDTMAENQTVVSRSDVDVTTSWQRKYCTFIWDRTNKVTMSLYTNSGIATNYYISSIKLEKGNVPTDWTPAPEDTLGAIDDVNSALNDTNSAIEGLSSEVDTKLDTQYQEITEMFDGYATTEVTDSLDERMAQNESSISTNSQDIADIQENGVSRVVTTTGYTFDNLGLHITRTGAKTSSLYDETGITITDQTSAVASELFFAGFDNSLNESIVRSKNITVDKYLVIGNHLRVENYTETGENPGTGFFYI